MIIFLKCHVFDWISLLHSNCLILGRAHRYYTLIPYPGSCYRDRNK